MSVLSLVSLSTENRVLLHCLENNDLTKNFRIFFVGVEDVIE